MSEAAPLTPYSAEYLSLLARKRKLTAKKVGNTWYTTKAILDEYMRRQMIRNQIQHGDLSSLANHIPVAPAPAVVPVPVPTTPAPVPLAVPVVSPVPAIERAAAPTAAPVVAPVPEARPSALPSDEMFVYRKVPTDKAAEDRAVDHPLTNRVRTFHGDLNAYLQKLNQPDASTIVRDHGRETEQQTRAKFMNIPEKFRSLMGEMRSSAASAAVPTAPAAVPVAPVAPVAPATPTAPSASIVSAAPIAKPAVKKPQPAAPLPVAPHIVAPPVATPVVRPAAIAAKSAPQTVPQTVPQAAPALVRAPIAPTVPALPATTAAVMPPAQKPQAPVPVPAGLDAIAATLAQIADRLDKLSQAKAAPLAPTAPVALSAAPIAFGPEAANEFAKALGEKLKISQGQPNILSRSFKTVFGSKPLIYAAIGLIVFFSIFPTPFVFGFFDGAVAAVKNAIADANTVMGFRPGTHQNELLLLDKQGNISIMGHIETDGQFRSYAKDGIAPIVVDSKTEVKNLNTEMVGSMHPTDFTLAYVTKNGNVTTEDVFLNGNVEVGKQLLVRGASKLLSSLSVDGGLSVLGDARVAKSLSVDGPAYFATVLNAANIRSSGVASLGDVITAGNVTIKKNIAVRGSIEAGHAVNAQSAAFGSAGISGDFSASGKVTLGNPDDEILIDSKNATLDADGNLALQGGATIAGGLTVTGGLSGASISVSNFVASNASTTFLLALEASTTNATSTTLFASIGHIATGVIDSLSSAVANIATLAANSITVGALTATNSTTTNASTTNGYVSNLAADNSTTTNAYIASLGAGNVTAASATVTNATTTNATTTNEFIANIVATNAAVTQASLTNASITSAAIAGAIIVNSTTTNATTTNLAAGNITATGTIAFPNIGSNMVLSTDAQSRVVSTSSPQVAAIFATSSSAVSTFAGGVTVGPNTLAVLQSGNVGIGTGTPADRLNVVTAAAITGTGGSGYLRFVASGGTNHIQSGLDMLNNSAAPLTFGSINNATEWARFGSNGFLGIGTNNPQSILDVAGNIYSSNPMTDTPFNGTTQSGVANFVGTNGYWALRTGTNRSYNLDVYNGAIPFAAMTVLQNGNVGIGTTTPASKLSIAGDAYIGGDISSNNLTAANGVTATAFTATSSSATSTLAGFLNVNGLNSTSTFAGNVAVSGNLSFGVGIGTKLAINSAINSDLVPDVNIMRNIGSPAFYWKNGYFDNLNVNSISAASTTIAGTASNSFTINSDNATADAEDMQLIFKRGTVTPNALLAWNSTTKRFEINQPVYIQNQSNDNLITLDIQGNAAQTTDLARISSSTGAYYFNVANNGNVGIGTSTPFAKLSIAGDAYIGGNITATGSASLQNMTFANATGTSATTTNFYATNLVASNLVFGSQTSTFSTSTNSTSTNLYSANGYISNLTAPLIIAGNVTASGTLALTAVGANMLVSTDGSSRVVATSSPQVAAIFATSSSATSTFAGGAVLATAGGNVGIGTSTPWAQLSVNAAPGTPQFAIGSSSATTFVVDQNGSVGIGSMPVSAANLLTVGAATNEQFIANKNGTVSAWSDVSGPIFTAYQRGGSYSSSPASAAIVANTQNGAGSSNYLFSGMVGSTNAFNVRADGLGYLAAGLNVATTSQNGILAVQSGSGSNSPAAYFSGGWNGTNPVVKIDTSLGQASPAIDLVGSTSVYPSTVRAQNSLQFATLNNGNVSLMPGGTGRVGIGTTSPVAALAIQNSVPAIYLSTGTGEIPLTIQANNNLPVDTTNPYIRTGGGGSLQINSSNATGSFGKLFLNPDRNSDVVMATGGGNVSIGTSVSSSYKLNVNGGNLGVFNASNPAIAIGDSAAPFYFTNAGSYLNISSYDQTAANTKVSIARDSGNVGIGTTTPTANVSVAGAGPVIQLFDTAQTMPAGLYNIQNSNDNLSIYRGVLGFSANERMRISNGGLVTTAGGFASDATTGGNFTGTHAVYIPNSGNSYINNGGNVGIGTTSPTAKFEVNGNGYISGGLGVGIVPSYALDIAGAAPVIRIRDNSTGGVQQSIQGSGGVLSLTADAGNAAAGSRAITFNLFNTEAARVATNGNFGIGTTSPSQALSVQGNLLVSGNIFGSGYTATGTISAPNFVATSATATSTYAGGITGPNNFTVQQSSGNVGIGTANPSYPLDVYPAMTGKGARIGTAALGDWNAFGATAGFAMFSNTSTAGNSGSYALLQAADGRTYLNGASGKGINFRINNADQAVIDQNGNFGLGTTTPASVLSIDNTNADIQVVGGASDSLNLRGKTDSVTPSLGLFHDTNGLRQDGYYVKLNPTGTDLNKLTFVSRTSNVDINRVTFDGSGNVGIGTTSPAYKLSVTGSNGSDIAVDNGSSQYVGFDINSNAVRKGIVQVDNTNGLFNVGGDSGVATALLTGGNEKARILTNGNFGIGTTNPLNKLQVNVSPAAASADGFALTDGSHSAALSLTGSSYSYAGIGANELWLYVNSLTNAIDIGSDGAVPVRFMSAGAERGRLAANGNFGLGTTTPPSNAKLYVGSGDIGLDPNQSIKLNYGGANQFISYKTAVTQPGIEIQGDANGPANFGNGGLAVGSYGNGGTAIPNNSLIVSGNLGVGTPTPGAALDVNGDIRYANTRTVTLTRSIPTTLNNEVDIGTFTFTNGAANLDVRVTVPSGANSVAKRYVLPIQYAQAPNNTWVTALPISSTGAYGGNDFALDIQVSNNNALLRLRNTGGSTAGTAYITILQQGVNTDTFSASSATSAVSAPTQYFAPTALTQVGGQVGINTLAPTAKLTITNNIGTGTGDATNGGDIQIGGNCNGDCSTNVGGIDFKTAVAGSNGYGMKIGGYAANGLAGLQFLGRQNSNSWTEAMRVTSSGNVGIGTTTPATKLGINGTGELLRLEDSASSNVRLSIGTTNNGGSNQYGYIQEYQNNTGNAGVSPIAINPSGGSVFIATSTSGAATEKVRIYTQPGGTHLALANPSGDTWAINGNDGGSNNALDIYSGSGSTGSEIYTPRLTILNNGSVGVGNTNPGALLEVGTTATAGTGLIVHGGDGGSGTTIANFQKNGGASALYVRGDANVGIGTTNPQDLLDVSKNNSAATGGSLVVSNYAAAAAGNASEVTFAANSAFAGGVASARIKAITPSANNNTDLAFVDYNATTGETERMRINSSGNVGIGTSSPTNRLVVSGNGGSGNNALLTLDNGAGTGGVGMRLVSYNAGTPSSDLLSTSFTGGFEFNTSSGITMAKNASNNPAGSNNILSAAGSVGIGATYGNGNSSAPSSGLAVEGSVGIGTTSPEQASKVAVAVTGANPALSMTWDGVGAGNWSFNPFILTVSNGGFSLVDNKNGRTPFVISDSGAVGIGTTGPQANLDVYGPSGTTQTNIARFYNSTNGGYTSMSAAGSASAVPTWSNGSQIVEFVPFSTGDGIIDSYTGSLRLQTGRVDRLTLMNGGNVGIGTTNPGAPLEVYAAGADNSTTTNLFLSSAHGTNRLIALDFGRSGSPGGNYDSRIVSNMNAANVYGTTLQFQTHKNVNDSSAAGFNTGLLIDMSGNVGIGTMAPNAKLTISNNVATGFLDAYSKYQAVLYDSGSAATSYGLGIKSNTLTFNSGGGAYEFDRAGGATEMMIDTGGNVGIGTTNPTAKLQVDNGNIAASSTNGFVALYQDNAILWKANANQGGLRFGSASDANAGSFSEKVRISDAGNVGIGTTNPQEKLHVSGGGSAGTTYWSALIDPQGLNGASAPGILLGQSSGVSAIQVASNGNLALNPTGGNVGINNTSPSASLDIAGSGSYAQNGWGRSLRLSNSSALFWAANGGYTFSIGQSGPQLYFGRATSETGGTGTQTYDMVIDSSGRVGIGQSSPASKLDVNGQVRLGNAGVDSYFSYGSDNDFFLTMGNNSTSFGSVRDSSGTEYVRFLHGGNVGIGSTTPSAGLSIQTEGSDYADGSLLMVNSTNASFGGGASIAGIKSARTDSSTFNLLNIQNASGSKLVVRGDGSVGIGTTSPWTKLDVTANAASRGPEIALTDTSGNANARNWVMANAAGPLAYGSIGFYNSSTPGGSPLSGTARMVIDKDGNVGIGTAGPAFKLDVQNTSANSDISLGQGGNNELLLDWRYNATPANAYGEISTYGGNNPLYVQAQGGGGNTYINPSTGRVGIGTTNPLAKLDIASSTGVINTATALRVRNGNDWGGSGAYVDIGSNSWIGGRIGGIIINGNTGEGAMTFSTSPNGSTMNEAMRIDKSGNVGIGITSPTYRFDVNSSSNQEFIGRFIGGLASGGNTYSSIQIGSAGDTTYKAGHIGYFTNPTTPAQSGLYLTNYSDSELTGGLFVQKGGNVGIGTATPQGKLNINSVSANPTLQTYNGALVIDSTDAKTSLQMGNFVSGSSGSWIQSFNEPATAAGNFNLSLNPLGGNVGIGTTSPYVKLAVAGGIVSDTIAATSTVATSTFAGGLDVNNGSLRYDYSSGVTSIDNLELGATTFDTNAGQVSWVDMPITSAAAAGTKESYTAQLNGNPILTVYGESDGAGGVQNTRVGIGTTAPGNKLHVVSGTAYSTAGNDTAKLETNGVSGIGLASSIGFQVTQTNSQSARLAAIGTNFAFNWGGDMIFYTKPANGTPNDTVVENMRLTNAGNLGIGTTSPAAEINTYQGGSGSYVLGYGVLNTATPYSAVFSNNTSATLTGGASSQAALVNTAAPAVGNVTSLAFDGTGRSASDILEYWKIGSVITATDPTVNNQTADLAFVTKKAGSYPYADTERMRITSAGNVGIGTTSPAQPLSVNGNSYLVGNVTINKDANSFTSASVTSTSANYGFFQNGSGQIVLGVNNSANSGIYTNGSAAYSSFIGSNNSTPLDILTNSTTRMTVTSAGNVGIGTTTPSAKLQIDQSSGAYPLLISSPNWNHGITSTAATNVAMFQELHSSGGNIVRYFSSGADFTPVTFYGIHGNTAPTTAAMAFNASKRSGTSQTNLANTETAFKFDNWGTNLVTILGSGNVGVGTTTPNRLLEVGTVGSSIPNNTAQIAAQTGVAAANGNKAIYLFNNGSTIKLDAYDYGASAALPVQVGGNGGNVLLVPSGGGNAGIGTSNPGTKLEIQGDANTSGTGGDNSQLYITGSTSNTKRLSIAFNTSSNYGELQARTGAGAYVPININPNGGNVGIGNTSPGAKLDLKESVNDYVGIGMQALTGTKWYMNAGISGVNNGEFAISTTANGTSPAFSILNTGNVGIGTTNPGSLGTMTGGLDINGSGASGSTQLFVERGGNRALAVNTSETTTGDVNFYDYAAGSWNRDITLKSGNVGIGTTGPIKKLEVAGAVTGASDFSTVSSFQSPGANTNDWTGYGIRLYPGGSGAIKSGMVMQRTGTFGVGNLLFLNNATSDDSNASLSDARMTITSSGNVGIGNTSPNYLLNVYKNFGGGASGGATVMRVEGQSVSDANYTLATFVHGGNVPTLQVMASGNVGIGTSTPSQKLDVNGNILIEGSNGLMAPYAIVGQSTNLGTGYYSAVYGSSKGLYIGTGSTQLSLGDTAGNNFDFARNNSTGALSIQGTQTGFNNIILAPTSGNVGIGTSSPNSILSVSGPTFLAATNSGQTDLTVYHTDAAGAANDTTMRLTANANGSTLFDGYGNKLAFAINGSLGQNDIAAISSRRDTSDNSGALAFYTANSGSLNERMRLDRQGHLGINQTPDTSAVLSVTGGTAAYFIGNVGIGSNIAGNTLDVRNSNNYQIRFGNTTGSTYDMGRNNSDGLMYFYGYQTGQEGYVFTGQDGERMRIATNGNVGIGTSTPFANLSVNQSAGQVAFAVGSSTNTSFIVDQNGYVGIGTSATTKQLTIQDKINNTPTLELHNNNGGSFDIGLDSSSNSAFINNGQDFVWKSFSSEKMRFRSVAGNLGIGDAAPAAKLSIIGNAAIGFTSGQTAPTNGLIVSGNVGVGTSSPGTRLQVAADSTYTGSGGEQVRISGASNDNQRLALGYNTNTDTGFIESYKDFGNTSTFKLALQPEGGNVGIGTTSPASVFTVVGGGACFSGSGATAACGNTAGNLYYRTANTGTYDVAENYTATDASIGAGDIVALNPSASTTIMRAVQGSTILGIISTDPGMVLGGADAAVMNSSSTRPVALSGRVPVKVNGEGGAIAIGDRISLSSVAGVGKKASGSEVTVGTALESWSGTALDQGLITVFVSNKQQLDQNQFSIDASGNVGIGTTTPMYKMQVNGDIAATAFVNVSTRSAKKDISYLDDAAKISMLDKLKTVGVATYRYNTEDETAPLRMGLIAEEAPSEVLADTGKGVDIYKMSAFILAGVQELAKKFDALDAQVAQNTADIASIKALIASSTVATAGTTTAAVTASSTQTIVWSSDLGAEILSFLQTAGLKLENGIAYMANAVFDKLTATVAYVNTATIDSASVGALTVGTADKRTGITLYDQLTGDPYCLQIAGGQTRTQAGACPAVATSTAPVAAPAPGVSGSLIQTSGSTGTTTPQAIQPSSTVEGTTTITTTPTTAPTDTASSTVTTYATDTTATSTATSTGTMTSTATSTTDTTTITTASTTDATTTSAAVSTSTPSTTSAPATTTDATVAMSTSTSTSTTTTP